MYTSEFKLYCHLVVLPLIVMLLFILFIPFFQSTVALIIFSLIFLCLLFFGMFVKCYEEKRKMKLDRIQRNELKPLKEDAERKLSIYKSFSEYSFAVLVGVIFANYLQKRSQMLISVFLQFLKSPSSTDLAAFLIATILGILGLYAIVGFVIFGCKYIVKIIEIESYSLKLKEVSPRV